MRVKTVDIKDGKGIVLAKISNKIKQKKMQGVYDNNNQKPADILRKRRSYDFKKEFTRYIDANYGDVLSKKDKKKLQNVVEEHYEEGCIENVEDLHKHIEELGKKSGILFDE